MLFFDKSNKRSIKLETAVTWSKSNLNMMNIYEESTINFWICVDFHLVRMTRLWNNRNQESSSRFIHIYFFNSIQFILKIVDFISSVGFVFYVCYVSTLNWIELNAIIEILLKVTSNTTSLIPTSMIQNVLVIYVKYTS